MTDPKTILGILCLAGIIILIGAIIFFKSLNLHLEDEDDKKKNPPIKFG